MDNENKERFPSNSKSKRVVPIREVVENELEDTRPVSAEESRGRRRVRAKAIRQKRTFAQTIAEMFVGEGRSIGDYILRDVLVPAAKSTINDMITTGIEMLLYGDGGKPSSRSRDKRGTTVSYGSYYKSRDEREERHSRSVVRRGRFNLDEILFRDHNEAEDVLDGLCEALEEYDQVTVAEYFELAGIDGATWVHDKWGWTNLKKAYLTHTRGGYAIVLPEPVELD